STTRLVSDAISAYAAPGTSFVDTTALFASRVAMRVTALVARFSIAATWIAFFVATGGRRRELWRMCCLRTSKSLRSIVTILRWSVAITITWSDAVTFAPIHYII